MNKDDELKLRMGLLEFKEATTEKEMNDTTDWIIRFVNDRLRGSQ